MREVIGFIVILIGGCAVFYILVKVIERIFSHMKNKHPIYNAIIIAIGIGLYFFMLPSCACI